MVVTETFLKAKKDKHLRALIVAHRMDNGKERTNMYLCIDEPGKYESSNKVVYVETDTTFRITNYSPFIAGTNEREGSTNEICFHLDARGIDGAGHVVTFLNAIKKDSDVSFRIVAYNGTDYYKSLGLVSHQLYGYVDENRYLLADYVGKDNSASPIK